MALTGSTKLTGQSGFLGCFPSVLAGAGPAYASSLVDGVAEPEGVASFVFGEPVVALRPRVRVPGLQACQDGRPPRVDGRGEAVDLGCAGRRGVVVERVQAPRDHASVGVGPGQGEQGAQVFFDDVGAQDLQAGGAGVDQRVPHLDERLGAQVLVAGEQAAPDPPGWVDLAAAADRSLLTCVMASRHGAGWASNHPDTTAAERPSTCARSPPVPAESTNPVCHRSQVRTHLPVPASRFQTGLPRLVSSMPSTTGSGGPRSTTRSSPASIRPWPLRCRSWRSSASSRPGAVDPSGNAMPARAGGS